MKHISSDALLKCNYVCIQNPNEHPNIFMKHSHNHYEFIYFESGNIKHVVENREYHFPEPEQLIRRLSGLLKPGGTLTVAHGMSRAHIDAHHQGAASRVSIGLMHEDALAAIFRKYLHLTTKLSTDTMYQISGQNL